MNSDRTYRAAAFAVATIVAIALVSGYHAAAHASYRSALGDRPLEARLDSANRAADLEPWNREFHLRVIRVQAEILFRAEDYDGAHSLMQPVVAAGEADAEFIEFYRSVNAEWIPWSAGKAHQQHGHEGPGGTLRPEDIER